MNTHHARVTRIADRIEDRTRCPECGNHPTRFIGTDDDGAFISETMPESGCPACGREPRHTVHLVGIDVASVFPRAEKAG